MRGEAVPYHVRRQVVKYANLAAVAGQQFPERLPGHRRPARRNEHESARTALEKSRAPVAQIPVERLPSRFAKRNYPLLVALADYAQHPQLALHRRKLQPAQLRDTEAGRIKQLEHRPVS